MKKIENWNKNNDNNSDWLSFGLSSSTNGGKTDAKGLGFIPASHLFWIY